MFDTAQCEPDLDVDSPSDEQLVVLSDDALIERLRADEVRRRQIEADQAWTIHQLDRRRTYRRDGHASIRGLVRVVTKRPNWEIVALLQTGRLMDREPSFAQAFRAGRLGVAQAHLIARAAAHPRCGDDVTGTELDELVDEAVDGTFSSFHTAIRDWVNLHDQDGANHDAVVDHEHRDAWFGFAGDEFHGRVQGATLTGEAVVNAFERFVQAEWTNDWTWTVERYGADGACEDKMPRTPAQRRHDAFVAMVNAAVSTPPDAQPPEPIVNVHTDSDTFLEGLARYFGITIEEVVDPATGSRRHRFCHTASGVAVSPDEMVAAALAGYVRRVVMDPRGVVIDMGRKQRLFTGELRVAAHMDRHRCFWPGCEVPATKCQTDHMTDWSKGGCTCPEDGIPACPRHNLFKNRGYTARRGRKGRVRTYRPDGTEIC